MLTVTRTTAGRAAARADTSTMPGKAPKSGAHQRVGALSQETLQLPGRPLTCH